VVVGAIVNAANEGCLGGGSVDGAINNAGERELWHDREARMTTTGHYMFRMWSMRWDRIIVNLRRMRMIGMIEMNMTKEKQYYHSPDQLLRSAYQESLARCRENSITDVAFSLLSAGIFRGSRTVEEVLTIGVVAIRDWMTTTTSSSNSTSTRTNNKITIETDTETTTTTTTRKKSNTTKKIEYLYCS